MFAGMFELLLEKEAAKGTGRVKWVDHMNALGVISTDGGIEVPFYCETIGFEACGNLREGEDVEFEILSEGNFQEACNIQKIPLEN